MLELILKGRPRFYLWLCFLGAIFGLGFIVYIFQANIGLAAIGADAVAHALGRGPVAGLFLAPLRPLPEAGLDGRRLELVRALVEA